MANRRTETEGRYYPLWHKAVCGMVWFTMGTWLTPSYPISISFRGHGFLLLVPYKWSISQRQIPVKWYMGGMPFWWFQACHLMAILLYNLLYTKAREARSHAPSRISIGWTASLISRNTKDFTTTTTKKRHKLSWQQGG